MTDPFYTSTAWRHARAAARRRDGNRCVVCGLGPADGVRLDVDHIEPISKRPDLALELANLRTLCRLHHNRRTARQRQPKRRNSRRW